MKIDWKEKKLVKLAGLMPEVLLGIVHMNFDHKD